MNKNTHRSWGKKDTLFYCPKKMLVWSEDNVGKIHIFKDMPTYGLERKEMK